MDGTLLDTEEAYRIALQEAVEACGHRAGEDFYAALVGISSRERGALVRAALGPDFPWEECLRDYRARKARLLSGALRSKPGANELLAEIAEQRLSCAVATSASRRTALVALKAAGLLHSIPVLITRDDVSAGKPDPAVFLRAATSLGAEPARCLAVEDSPPGITAALEAGMRVVMVPDVVPPSAALRQAGLVIAADLLEVRAMLRNLRNGEALMP
ncbi:HAD family phosphatase [Roseomonas sp. SSH11]|uniref:HAD family phosphatase n=2 Tax=Pararoseomonas baculiformis TaxID=2820812 RepID=A0ABS4A9E1_9PROT|nr:HAD family phosphatase [Pararoseomonas baculiformis]